MRSSQPSRGWGVRSKRGDRQQTVPSMQSFSYCMSCIVMKLLTCPITLLLACRGCKQF